MKTTFPVIAQDSGPITRGGKRCGAVHDCFRCGVPVRDQFLSRGPTRLVDARTLRPHQHDWSRVPVPDPIEVRREQDHQCNARCENRAVLTGRVGIMAWSLCALHASDLVSRLNECLTERAAQNLYAHETGGDRDEWGALNETEKKHWRAAAATQETR